jgi:16S rRNA (cytosine967-C5)-methyltransferase
VSAGDTAKAPSSNVKASGKAGKPTARTSARVVLERVLKDGAFAAAALDAELSRNVQLRGADAGLATELAYGSVRHLRGLERELGKHAPKGIDKLEATTRASLVVAAYQIMFLDRVPAYAAVNECVSEVRRLRGQGLGGFCNALLRKLTKHVEAQRSAGKLAELRASVQSASIEAWFTKACERSLGPERSVQYLRDCFAPAPTCVRAVTAIAEELTAQLTQVADRVEPGALPGSLRLWHAGDLAQQPGHEKTWIVQEEGSQWVAECLGAQPGEHVLDACAGRGQKSLRLAADIGPQGKLESCDLHLAKLERLATRMQAMLGSAIPAWTHHAVDWAKGKGKAAEGFDRILLDAPCSGSGTMRRRPDIFLRRTEASVQELQALQIAILCRLAPLLKPGGIFVYAVCSIFSEEAEQVLTAALPKIREEHGVTLEPTPLPSERARAFFGDVASVRMLPELHGTDGYFVASFRRV